MRKLRNRFLNIGIVMLLVFTVFIIYVLGHPEESFPWSNTITYTIYAVWLIVMIVCFIADVIIKRKNK